MRYLLAFLCPPLAILLCGKPIKALICIPLYCIYFPAALWALLIVSGHHADTRNRALIRNANQNTKAQIAAINRQTREMTQALREQQAPVIEVHVHQAGPQPLPTGTRSLPRSEETWLEVEADQVVELPPPPRKPLITVEGVRDFVVRARDGAIAGREGAIVAYQNLPEWAQPITWGFAAATPVSFVLVVLFLRG